MPKILQVQQLSTSPPTPSNPWIQSPAAYSALHTPRHPSRTFYDITRQKCPSSYAIVLRTPRYSGTIMIWDITDDVILLEHSMTSSRMVPFVSPYHPINSTNDVKNDDVIKKMTSKMTSSWWCRLFLKVFLPYLITMPSYISNIPFFEKLPRMWDQKMTPDQIGL